MVKEFPFSCSYVKDEALEKKGYRKVIVDNYIGLYIIDEYKKQVVIMRVLHGRQIYQDLI